MCPNMCAFVACVCKLRPYKKRNQKREEGKEEMKGPEGGGVGGGGGDGREGKKHAMLCHCGFTQAKITSESESCD